MSSDEKIAFFRVGYTLNGYPLAVQAYVADIPAEGDVKGLTLRGPFNVTTKEEKAHPGNLLSGTPVYDYQQSEIVWSCHGGPYSNTFYSIINVWRLGEHFSLQSIEPTPLKANYLSASSVILENGTVSVGVAEKDLLNDVNPTAITTSRRGQDGKWVALPFNTTASASVGTSVLLFKPPRQELKYVFYLRAERSPSSILHIDQVKEAKFAQIPNNDNIIWQHFAVDLGFQVQGQYTAHVLYDEDTGKNRLYIFEAHSIHQGIKYAYIPLRKDGSIDLSEETSQALGGQYLRAPVGPRLSSLKVLESGGRLILLGEEWTGSDTKDKIFGHSGAVKRNGSAPDGNQWTDVQVGFKTKQNWHDDKRFSYSAVVVPSDFE
ncbi:Fc.00g100730.m01.CDS01 [Cosmosporella sp. VM-42]